MKKIILTGILSVTSCLTGLSADFFDNGFAFDIISDQENLCSIVENENAPYSGDIVIPSVANFNGKEYQVYQIGEHAFSQCEGVTSIVIPASLKSIKNNSFDRCSNLRKIIIEDADIPLAIGRRTGGSSMTSLFYYVPVDDLYIGRDLTYNVNGNNGIYGPFSDSCTEGQDHNLKVTFGELVTTVPDYLFAYRGDISELTFGPNITTIGASAFNQSLKISSLVFPESIETIGTNAFYGNHSLSDIVLGANVKTLSAYSFASCSGITSVYCYALNPPTANNAAYSYNLMNARLRVPAASLEKYKSSTTWKEFGEILPFGEDVKHYPSKYTVSILLPGNGSISQLANEGSSLAFNVKSNDGWVLHSVCINGADISSSISENGDFETGPINSDLEISVVFGSTSDITDAVEKEDPDIRVTVSGRTVNIQGEYEAAALYNINGRCIRTEHNATFEIEDQGLYVIRIKDKSYKFMVR